MRIKQKISLIWGIFYLIILTQQLAARDNSLKFKHINEGLSQSTVQAIIQDNKGFIWIGTNNGLNRYDGTEFTIYESLANNSTSLSDKRITALCEDSSGAIWIGTSLGLNRYDRNHDYFIRYFADAAKPGTISDDAITSIVQDSAGNLWIGTDAGINRYDRERDRFIIYDEKKGLLSTQVNEIAKDSKGNLWAATQGGFLHFFDAASDRFIPHKEFNEQLSELSVQTVGAMAGDAQGNLWLGTSGYGIVILKEDKPCIHYIHDDNDPGSLAHDVIMSLYKDCSERMWVGTENYGLDLFNREDKNFTHFSYNPNDTYSLSSNSIYSIFEDKEGKLWVGTFHTGLNVMDPYQEKFSHYRHIANLKNSLSNNIVTTVLEDASGNLWIGTDGGGLNYFNPKHNSFRHYRQEPQGLKSDAVLSLCYDDDTNLWIGTWAGGINVYNSHNNSFTYYNQENCGLENNNIYNLLKASDGKIYIGTNGGGLSIFDKTHNTFVTHRYNSTDTMSLSSDVIRCIYQDRAGTIWVGTYSEGLNRLQEDDTGKITFKRYQNANSKISDGHITSMYEDVKGNFWVGTLDGGLNRMDRNTGDCKVYRKEEGLPGNSVMGILEDFSGNLWISTGSGLCKFNPDKETFRIYNLSDGLQGKEFSLNAAYKTRRGDLLFGGRSGFNLFNPEQVRDNPHTPAVYITGFRIQNKPVKVGDEKSPLKRHVSETEELVLSYKQSFLSFDYVGINYSHGDKNQYAYILEGLEEEWNYVGIQRTASYTNLSPGDYVFRVKAANNDNRWNEQGVCIKITIDPPFWVTWWFRLLAVLTIMAGAYLWYRQRMNRIRRQNRELEQKVAERTEDLRNKTIALEASKKETDDILHTVSEGLFLLNRKHQLGSQYAMVLEKIFEKEKLAHSNFFDLIKEGITKESLSTIKRYFSLLFKKDIDEEILDSLNPLIHMEIHIGKQKQLKHLAFEFSRIYNKEGVITELMASVRDITEQVLLEQKLVESEKRTNRQLNWMLSILHVEPDMLQDFIESVQREVDAIEGILDLDFGRNNFKMRLEKIYRSMHLIKGNASLLALQFFADQAHQFEDIISGIQKKERIVANDFQSLKEKLKDIRESIKEVHGLLDRIHKLHTQMRPKRSYEQKMLLQSFINLTEQMGQDSGKNIQLNHDDFNINDIPHKNQLLVKEILIQLLRNAIAHGIELPEERENAGKSAQAKIEISTSRIKDSFIIRVRDDGRGLQIEKLRQRAKESGKWPEKEVNHWTTEQVINSIFVSGITTSDDITQISGRGVGMDLVKKELETHKGTIDIKFENGKYSEFKIKLPLEEN
jgi:ligand-binding sensor domain-containing protein/signal transduction histidine kinase